MKYVINDIKKVMLPTIITIIIGLVAFYVIGLWAKESYAICVHTDMWRVASEYMQIVYVLIAVIPLGWIMFYEVKNNFHIYSAIRSSKAKYLLSKWLTCGVAAGVIIFSISFIGHLNFELFIQNWESFMDKEEIENIISITYKGKFCYYHPTLYVFIVSLWRGVLAFLFQTMSFILALFVDNLFVVLCSPYLINIIYMYVTATLNIERYSTMASFDWGYIDTTNVGTIIMGGVAIAIIDVVILLYFMIIKKEKIFDI